MDSKNECVSVNVEDFQMEFSVRLFEDKTGF